MKVLKFGGTSVGSAENIRKVKSIIESQKGDVIIVVSALGGITDKILAAARNASKGAGDFHADLKEIKTRHQEVIQSLFNSSGSIKLIVDGLLDELEQILTGITLVGELTAKTLDRIAGIGERISSHIVAQFIGAERFDSSEFIRTDSNFGKAAVDFVVTNKNIQDIFVDFKGVAVVPGFISKNAKGEFTTIGRGGSDYTAAIISAALNANILEIWTDVNGFMTADPRIISKAYTIPELTYSEAMELSHFGAKVIYPPTILPVYKKRIPILIKNTFEPENQGTRTLKMALTEL
jgi:aspartokinase/homoserine dehydrogenase 1